MWTLTTGWMTNKMYYDYFTFPFWTDVFTILAVVGIFFYCRNTEDDLTKLAQRVRHIEPRVMKKVHKANNRAKAVSGKTN